MALGCIPGLAGAAPAWATGQTLYVSSAGTDSGSCGSSASPCLTITQALTNATSDTPVIYVSGTIANDDITISGSDMSVTIEKNPSATGTVEIDEAYTNSDQDTNPLFDVENGATVTITGLTLRGLAATAGGGSEDSGGGIYDDSSGTVTATDDTFYASSGDGGGGIAVVGGGAVSASDDSFDENGSGSGDGGAIWVEDGTQLTVSDSSFNDDPAGANGGAIAIDGDGTTATVTGSTFSDDPASGDGGAIAVDSASALSISDSTFSDGTATGNGGAVAVDGAATLAVNNSTFYENVGASGGALYLGAASAGATITDSTFDANATSSEGVGGTTNSDANGNTVYSAATGAAAPVVAGDLFYGTCALNDTVVDDGYNAAQDGSCLGSGPPSTDQISVDAGDLSGLESEAAGAPQTIVVGAANPAAGLIPSGISVEINSVSTSLCPATDEAGVASSGACNAGASQETPTPRPELYVAYGGSDTSNNCTDSANPCATISNALAQVNEYSQPTVYLSGDISEDNIAIDQDVTITSAGVPDIVISGSNVATVFTISSGVTATIEELTISNGLSQQQGPSVPSQGGASRATRHCSSATCPNPTPIPTRNNGPSPQ